MAGDRRAQLVDAGVMLAVQQRFQDLLASVDTRSITDRAGVTTGSFFHHFGNRAHFAEAVAERFVELWKVSVDQVVADTSALAGGEADGDVRSVAQADWDKLETAMTEADLLHLLWVARDQPLSHEGGETAGELLDRCYQYLLDAGVPAFETAVAGMGREMMPPFDALDLSLALTALADGIQMRQAVHPQVVRPDLFADLVAGALVALTRPVGERGGPMDLADLERQLTAPVQLHPASAGEGETWRQIADAAAPLFVGRPLADVKVADIAEVAGVSSITVYHQFGTVSAVAACGWARLMPELAAISARPLTAAEGPIVRLEQVLARFIDLGREHRGALEGLVLEILAITGVDAGRPRPRDITEDVPLVDLLAPHLRELRARGQLRRRIEGIGLSRTILQLVSVRTLTTPHDSVERIIDDTLGIVLDGALVAGSGR
jgi:AcrR family transcriptional regulator